MNLTDDEVSAFEGVLNGSKYARVVDGRFQFLDAYHPPISPVDDPKLAEFWQENPKPASSTIFAIANRDPERAGLVIEHLCGYYYSRAGYQQQATKLESYGFVCMRSRRGLEGTFWEHWYLPWVDLSKGELGVAVKKATDKTRAAIDFLCDNVTFGSLSIFVQRAAARID